METLGTRKETHKNEEAKSDWARRLRLQHSPMELRTPSGAIDQLYYRPTSDELEIETQLTWTKENQAQLVEDLRTKGIGSLSISDYPGWDWESLLPQIQMCLGTTDLDKYADWTGDADAERLKNKHTYFLQNERSNIIAVPKCTL